MPIALTLRVSLIAPILAAPMANAALSPWLANPDSLQTYITSCADYWLNSEDLTYGGFYQRTDTAGNPTNFGKVVLNNSHTIYGLVRAFQMTGDEAYLDAAERALAFQYAHAWDAVNGGWNIYLNTNGSVKTSNSRNLQRWAFDQHYALLGIMAAAEATANPLHWQWLQTGMQTMNAHMWDPRPGLEGFYYMANQNWSSPYEKDFHANIDAITTHRLVYNLLRESSTEQAILYALGDRLLDRFIPSMSDPSVKLGFAEFYDADWNISPNPDGRVGHVLKASWVLSRLYLMSADPAYADGARFLLDYVLAAANPPMWDTVYGAPFSLYDPFTGVFRDDTRDYWQMQQAVMAGLLQYAIHGDEAALGIASDTLDFFMDHFWDSVNGEVWGATSRDGSVVTNGLKGQEWKGGYHSIELGWYAWLYSKVLLSGEPVTLHYRLADPAAPTTVRIVPFAALNGLWRITSATRNGAPAAPQYSAPNEIVLQPGDGGRYSFTLELDTAQWRYAYWIANPALGLAAADRDPDDDPDHDGKKNLLEYFFATPPHLADSTFTHTIERDGAGWAVRFRRRPDVSDLSWNLSYSTDLKTWAALGPAVLAVSSSAPDHLILKGPLPVEGDNVFVRFTISR